MKELSIQRCASLAYFPLIGWILPLVTNKNNSICKRHIKQAFVISMFFLLINAFLNLVNVFTPVELRLFRFGLVIAIYGINCLYLLFSLTAIRIVLKGGIFNLKIFNRYMDLIKL
ncbi:MAG: hypothetical protein JW864_18965 [Spirochaetes bacterium]|nr:hypothetical protein [Spirochaetota bacterium]